MAHGALGTANAVDDSPDLPSTGGPQTALQRVAENAPRYPTATMNGGNRRRDDNDAVSPAEIDNDGEWNDDEHNATSSYRLGEEARLLMGIALPTIVLQFSLYFLYPQTASALGLSLGTEELAGFSLASLAGNAACLSVIMGTLSASDTLQPRAYGTKDYGEVGRLAVRGFVASVLVLMPAVAVLLFGTEPILTGWGSQDPVASRLASMWVRVYLLGVPFVLLFRVVQRFLACQRVVLPVAAAAAVGCFVVHPVLLKVFVPWGDFLGSGVAVVTTQAVQAGLIFAYLAYARPPPHDPRTWPGLRSPGFVRAALLPRRVIRYLRLGLGGVLSFSEWWFWEAVCFTAGKFGIVPLCSHTVAYQLVPTLFMIPLGLSVGLGVRIGNVISHDAVKAKWITSRTMGCTAALAAVLAWSVHVLRQPIVAMFTSDPAVEEGCEQIWAFVSLHVFNLTIFGVNSGILRALGMQWLMALTIVGILWCGALPLIHHLAVRRGGGLVVMWMILPCAYFLMNVILASLYVTADWQEISDKIRAKQVRASETKEKGRDPGEDTKLLEARSLA